jgi:hypothetical protein
MSSKGDFVRQSYGAHLRRYFHTIIEPFFHNFFESRIHRKSRCGGAGQKHAEFVWLNRIIVIVSFFKAIRHRTCSLEFKNLHRAIYQRSHET